MNGTSVRNAWTARLLDQLPPEDEVIARNASITSTYAQFYLQRPELLKWAGLAAFASFRVGLALKPYYLVKQQNFDLRKLESKFLFEDLELIRRTNNQIFRDIGWMHAAFLTEGLPKVLAGLEDSAGHDFSREGFRRLDEGRIRLEHGDRTGSELVWDGNRLLLKQEQQVTVAPAFERLNRMFRGFLALVTEVRFAADFWGLDRSRQTSFAAYMWTRGWPMIWRTRAIPNICRVDHRWLWSEQRVLTIWRQIENLTGTREVIQKFTQIGRAVSATA